MEIYRVNVLGPAGQMKVIDLCSTSAEFNRLTVKDLKKKIVQTFGYYGFDDHVRMIFQGLRLDDDDRLLSSYGIQHMSVIQIVVKLRGGGCPDDLPTEENSGIGDKTGKNLSMERLCNFETTGQCPAQKNSELCANSDNKCTVL